MDKNFEEIFKSNKSSNSEEFYNCVLHLNNEIISIKEYLSDATIKKEFKRKDIFFELLFDCVNNCLFYCEKNINYNNFLNSLSDSFLSLIKNEEISNNSKTKDIIREFINYINSSLEYHNNIKNKIPQKVEEKKANDNETDELKKKLETLESLLNDYKTKYQMKEKEYKEEKNQKEEAI